MHTFNLFHHSKPYAIFIVTLVVAGIIVSYPLLDYDMYWHLANGREMLAQRYIVNTEIFSYTHAGTPFVNHEWLAQIVLFWIYQQWGGFGLNVFKVLMAVLTAALLYRSARDMGAESYLASFLTLIAVVICINRFNLRPELFSFVNLALLGYILHGYLQRRVAKRALCFLPIIMVLWDWLHGAVYGVALLGAIVFSENVKHWIKRRRGMHNSSADLLPGLNIWFAMTVAAMLVNPYGLRSYDIFIEFLRDNPLAARVVEFLPPTWETDAPYWVYLGLASVIVIIATIRKRMEITYFAVLLPFAALSLRFERATTIFAIVATPVLALLLPKLLDDLKGTSKNPDFIPTAALRKKFLAYILPICALRNFFRALHLGELWIFRGALKTLRFGPPLRTATILVGIGTLALYIAVVKFDTRQHTGLGFRVIESGLPVGSARFIQDVGLSGNMYNPGHFGGYLAFVLAPQHKIFQYNHHTVFGDTLRFLDHPEELNQWAINYAVVAYSKEIQLLFPPAQWATLYQENGASLLIRRAPQNADIIRDYETVYYQPFRYSFDDFRQLAADPRIYPRLIHEMGTYLAYRRDPRVSALFAELLTQGGDSIPTALRAHLINRALRFNAEDGTLRQFAQQRAVSMPAQ